ncbi:DUF2231 domain-containing protein [Streptomyces sp. NBC_01428]|uniref:DUF2231 domain-containing protein n=1 Tax=Streptomyces sp. NBC_01428 TaxID=2903861 RepID=UPI002E3675BC|nr:DUF2231 domain-containing protein [Streptomyces sp. NBC_01428]
MSTHADASTSSTAHRALDTASSGWLTALDRIERSEVADPVINMLQQGIRSLPLGSARDLLRGRQLGHPVHPVLVHVPIGCWLSAAVLDVVPSGRQSPAILTAVGLAGVAPAAVAGWVDWADLPPRQSRVGLLHAISNVAAVGFYTASLSARLRGRSAKGRLWALGGLTAVAVSGALGGHVAYRKDAEARPAP